MTEVNGPERARRWGQAAAEALRTAAAETAGCLRFFSRLPIPRLPWEATLHALPDFSVMPRMLPLAGALIGAIGGAVLLVGEAVALGAWVSAALAVTALVAATGALHEDGLADTADGFGGGDTPERRLDIMRDSRIGAYGAVAVVLSLILRVALIGTLGERLGAATVAAGVVFVGALSRSGALVPMALLAPARPAGLSQAVGRPSRPTLAAAWLLTGLIGLVLVLATDLALSGVLLAGVLAGLGALAVSRLAAARIQGQTGDVIGAAQQAAEVAALLALLIAAQP